MALLLNILYHWPSLFFKGKIPLIFKEEIKYILRYSFPNPCPCFPANTGICYKHLCSYSSLPTQPGEPEWLRKKSIHLWFDGQGQWTFPPTRQISRPLKIYAIVFFFFFLEDKYITSSLGHLSWEYLSPTHFF